MKYEAKEGKDKLCSIAIMDWTFDARIWIRIL